MPQTAPDIVAIVMAYWPSRWNNVPKVIQSIKESNLIPHKIIVWSNHQLFSDAMPYDPDITYIVSSSNFHAIARNMLGAAMREKYIYFQDDDVLIGPDTIGEFRNCLHNKSHSIVGLEGRILRLDTLAPYSSAKLLKNVDEATECDVVVGKCHMVHKSLCQSYLGSDLYHDYPIDDDVIKSSLALERWVVAKSETVYLSDLAAVEAYCMQEDHFHRRDTLCTILRVAIC